MLGLTTLVAAIKDVPEACSRSGMAGYTNLRSYFIGKIVEKAGFEISKSDLDVFVKIIESRCQTLLRSTSLELIDGVLWSLTEQEKINFNLLLLPPTTDCLSCEKPLVVNNKITKATVHGFNGPVPATKLLLRCRECNINYGIVNYSSSEPNEVHTYAKSFNVNLIEASNVTYMAKDIYKWIPSLG